MVYQELSICIRSLQSCVPANSRCSEHFKTLWKTKRIGNKVPYLSMFGGAHGGTYLIKLNKVKFAALVSENPTPF